MYVCTSVSQQDGRANIIVVRAHALAGPTLFPGLTVTRVPMCRLPFSFGRGPGSSVLQRSFPCSNRVRIYYALQCAVILKQTLSTIMYVYSTTNACPCVIRLSYQSLTYPVE